MNSSLFVRLIAEVYDCSTFRYFVSVKVRLHAASLRAANCFCIMVDANNSLAAPKGFCYRSQALTINKVAGYHPCFSLIPTDCVYPVPGKSLPTSRDIRNQQRAKDHFRSQLKADHELRKRLQDGSAAVLVKQSGIELVHKQHYSACYVDAGILPGLKEGDLVTSVWFYNFDGLPQVHFLRKFGRCTCCYACPPRNYKFLVKTRAKIPNWTGGAQLFGGPPSGVRGVVDENGLEIWIW